MALVSNEPELRAGKVRVAEFASSELRAALFARHHVALETWEQIERMLRANNVTEEEFFESWGDKNSWPSIDDTFYYNP